MNKAQHTKLEPVERILRTARESNYARLSPSDWKIIAESYEDIFGRKLTASQNNCSTCRLKAIKQVAEEYFNYKPTGRPKKIDLNVDE